MTTVKAVVKYTLHNIANGPAGIRATLKLMSKVTKHYKKSPIVRELALKIVRNVPQKQWALEARELLRWVQDNIRYAKDVRGVETLQSPPQTLRIGQGDCDDQSIMLASLLESIGHPTQFVAIGQTKNSLTHVLVRTRIGNKWVWADPITDWVLGKGPSNIRNYMIQHN